MELLEHRIRNQRFQRLVFPIYWLFVGIGLNLMGADKQSYKLAPYLGITGHRNQISQIQISCSKNCIREVDIIFTLFRQIYITPQVLVLRINTYTKIADIMPVATFFKQSGIVSVISEFEEDGWYTASICHPFTNISFMVPRENHGIKSTCR